MAFPQCPKCFDNLSKLVQPIVPMLDYPDGVCTVCCGELDKAARSMAQPKPWEFGDPIPEPSAVPGGAEGPLPAGGLEDGPDVAASGSGIPAWFDIPHNATVEYWEWRDGMGPRWLTVEGARAALLPDAVKADCLRAPGTYRTVFNPTNLPPVHYRTTVLGRHKPDPADNDPDAHGSQQQRAELPIVEYAEVSTDGATLLDRFAAHALVAIIGADATSQPFTGEVTGSESYNAAVAGYAYAIARAMMNERAKLSPGAVQVE